APAGLLARAAPRRRRPAPRLRSSRLAARLRPGGAGGRCATSRARASVASSADERLQRPAPQRRGLALDVALVPEREREQPPQLPREALLARHVSGDQLRHHL